MDTQKRMHGFGAVAALAIVVVVGAIGGLGWYIWQSQGQRQSEDQATSTKQPARQSAHTTDKGMISLSRAEIEKAPAETTKFSKLPSELRSAAIQEITKQAPECVKDNQMVNNQGQPEDPDVRYAPVGAAIIGIGCDGSAAGLFAKPKGDWMFVEKTQFSFTCDALVNNPVSKKLLELTPNGSECVDASGQPSTYDEASKKRYF